MEEEGVLQNHLLNPTKKNPQIKENKPKPPGKIRAAEGPEMVVAVADRHGRERRKAPGGNRELSRCSGMVGRGTAWVGSAQRATACFAPSIDADHGGLGSLRDGEQRGGMTQVASCPCATVWWPTDVRLQQLLKIWGAAVRMVKRSVFPLAFSHAGAQLLR